MISSFVPQPLAPFSNNYEDTYIYHLIPPFGRELLILSSNAAPVNYHPWPR